MNLNRIMRVEHKYGNISKLAEQMLAENLPAAIIDDILNILGDCAEYWDEAMQPSDRLKTLLLDMLEPLDEMGALTLGEEIAA